MIIIIIIIVVIIITMGTIPFSADQFTLKIEIFLFYL